MSSSFEIWFHAVLTLISSIAFVSVESYFTEKCLLTMVCKCMPETKVMDMTKCAQDQEPGLCGTKSRK